MAETQPPLDPSPIPEPPPVHPATRHERSDVTLYWFKIILGVSLLLAVFIEGVILWFQMKYLAHEDKVKKSDFAYHKQRPAFPPTPRLEPLEGTEAIKVTGEIIRSDVAERREEKETILTTYGAYPSLRAKEAILHSGGGPAEQSLHHIPIDRAMKLLVEGQAPKEFRLRVRPEPAGPQAKKDRLRESGLMFGGGPNSRRVFREGQR